MSFRRGIAAAVVAATGIVCTVRTTVAEDRAVAAVWQQEDDGSVRRVEVPLSEY